MSFHLSTKWYSLCICFGCGTYLVTNWLPTLDISLFRIANIIMRKMNKLNIYFWLFGFVVYVDRTAFSAIHFFTQRNTEQTIPHRTFISSNYHFGSSKLNMSWISRAHFGIKLNVVCCFMAFICSIRNSIIELKYSTFW